MASCPDSRVPDPHLRPRLTRRRFLAGSGALIGTSLAAGGPLDGLLARAAETTSGRTPLSAPAGEGGYGELVMKKPVVPVAGYEGRKWLALPEAFDYVVFSVSGRSMSDGNPTPLAHDGMSTFAFPDARIRLVRNHEVRTELLDAPTALTRPAYDSYGPAGTTTLEIVVDNGIPGLERDFVSLAGTYVNCAGGSSQRGSWLSCEETVAGVSEGWERDHGYVFEVPASADAVVQPRPLTHLGRFVHEAVAMDATGILYLTEDNGTESGFYRYLPPTGGTFADAGGRLEMLKVGGQPQYVTYRGQEKRRLLPVEWVPIEDPEPQGTNTHNPSLVFRQGFALGGAIFSRLEGAWRSCGVVYFTSTNGGDAENGQVWAYCPGLHGGRLWLEYESPHPDVLSFPDNLTFSPRGGLLLCEDSPNDVQFLRGLTRDGRVFNFAANTVDSYEWAGACFSPDGRFLFVNTQGPTTLDDEGVGRTYAIWGPWRRGAL